MTRVQIRRTPGYRKPAGVRSVTRSTRFGSPFPVANYRAGRSEGAAVRASLADYRRWIAGDPAYPDVYQVGKIRHPFDRRWVWAHLDQVTGVTLGCSCPVGQPCHADVLANLARTGQVSA